MSVKLFGIVVTALAVLAFMVLNPVYESIIQSVNPAEGTGVSSFMDNNESFKLDYIKSVTIRPDQGTEIKIVQQSNVEVKQVNDEWIISKSATNLKGSFEVQTIKCPGNSCPGQFHWWYTK